MTEGLPKHIIPNSQAHVDFLMQERVECLGKQGGYCMPMQPFKVGDVLHRTNGNISIWVNDEGGTLSCLVDEFPNLFVRLYWWQQRKEAEMPMYLKYKNDTHPYNMEYWKIGKWDAEKGFAYCADGVGWADLNRQQKITPDNNFLPATEEEYNNQNR